MSFPQLAQNLESNLREIDDDLITMEASVPLNFV